MDVRTGFAVRLVSSGNTLLTAAAPPAVETRGTTPVTGWRDRYITLDRTFGASSVWYRDTPGSGPWLLARHGISQHVCGDSIEFYPDAFDPDQYALFWVSDEPLPHPFPVADRPLPLTTYVDLDTSARTGTSGVRQSTPDASVFEAGSTLGSDTRWVVLDGRAGAAIAWVYDGETIQLAEHGRPVRVRGAPHVAPHPADRTSKVRLYKADGPVMLPPIDRRNVDVLLTESSDVGDHVFTLQYYPPDDGGVVSVEYAQDAGSAVDLLIEEVSDAGQATNVNVASFATVNLPNALGRFTFTCDHPALLSFRHEGSFNLRLRFSELRRAR